MAGKERVNNIKITLSLIALCLPLFSKYSVKAQNSCPYETYVRVDGKCLDISEKGLSDMTKKLDSNSRKEINQEIEELHEELEELGEELNELCVKEQPENKYQIEIIENVCQY